MKFITDLVSRFLNLIRKDVQSENEVKMSAVIIRVNALLWMCFFIVVLIEQIINFKPIAIGGTTIAIFFVALLFDLTYQNKAKLASAINLIGLIIIICSTFILFGAQTHCGNMFFVFIILLYTLDCVPHRLRFLILIATGIICAVFERVSMLYPNAYTLSSSELLFYRYFYVLLVCALTTATVHIATKDFSSMQQKLVAYNNKLHTAASIDPLTKINNRRSMIELMEKQIHSYNRGDISSISIAIADIDFFKKINDTYGHNGGDFILKELAKIFSGFMLNKGYVARWGGEEFLFIFINVNGDDAFIDLDKLRSHISNHEFHFEDKTIKLTMSFGLEEFDSRSDLDGNIMAADKKLYIAKSEGRNKVIY